MILIDDADDPRLAGFRRNERGLANRRQRRNDDGDGLFMAEGDLVVERALDAGCTAVIALVDAAKPPPITSRLPSGVPIYAGGDRVRSMVTQLGTPQGIVALFARPARVTVDVLSLQATRLIVAEAVDNPINVGSIVRNAVALGWHGMIFDYTSADPLSRRSLRVSMGQALTFPAARSTDLPGDLRRLATDGFAVCALTPAVDAVDIGSIAITEKMCIVIGSERAGLSNEALAACTHRVRIPMAAGVDSLNVAAATAIACYTLRG
ncbi:MAG TPA: RNA methyltransferase [Ilumatobacteraceae bacterium]|nr:RNA methyltransferase [Ilumatobacteraceae bacterium]